MKLHSKEEVSEPGQRIHLIRGESSRRRKGNGLGKCLRTFVAAKEFCSTQTKKMGLSEFDGEWIGS